jgi:hypothetical protein
MSIAISGGTPAQTEISSATSTQRSSGQSTQSGQSSQTQTAAVDAVQLSSTAQAALAARKELAETPAQTSQEAIKGDHQAQRLLAKENANKPAK